MIKRNNTNKELSKSDFEKKKGMRDQKNANYFLWEICYGWDVKRHLHVLSIRINPNRYR